MIGRTGSALPADTARSAGCLALIGVLAVVCYLPSLDNGFSLDDYNWLERVRFASSYLGFLLEPEPGEIFCPVSKGFLAVLYAAGDLQPLWYRIPILVLHILNAFLLFFLAERLFQSWQLALLSACLFAVNSSGSEAIFWIAAFFHPLSTTLYLATLLCFLRFLTTESLASYLVALFLFACGLFTKASFLTIIILLFISLFSGGAARISATQRARYFAPFALIFALVLVSNVLLVPESYLVERGYYAFGWHVATNFAEYVARLAVPFSSLFRQLGLENGYGMLFQTLALTLPIMLALACYFGNSSIRFVITLLVLGLASFLPFVFDPTSRYTYLASAGWALFAGFYLVRATRTLVSPRLFRGLSSLWILPLFVAPYFAEIRLKDNEFEYRERFMASLVADVTHIYPEPPDGKVITVIDFPRLAIDRGIHFQAALRLAYNDPAVRVTTLDQADHRDSADGTALLMFQDGRIQRFE